MTEAKQAEIRENIARIHGDMSAYPNAKLMAVIKTRTSEEINFAIRECGVSLVGENRVQELLAHYEEMDKTAELHFIGTLQKNKVKYIIDKVDMIESLDNEGLAEEIQKRAAKIGKIMPVLLEVNISGEESKYGMQAGDIDRILDAAEEFSNLKVKGLMTMAPIWANEYEIRTVFSKLYQIYIDISTKKYNNSNMEYLSMGMSNDYEIAAEEGANVLRVGRAVFAAE